MIALYKLNTNVLFKNPFLYVNFVISFMFLLVFGSILKASMVGVPDEFVRQAMTGLFGSLLVMIILNSGMYSFGYSFFLIKESVLLKRIGSTKITKMGAIFAYTLSGFTMLSINILWLFLAAFLLSGDVIGLIPSLNWDAGAQGWTGVIFGIIVAAIVSYITAFFFVSICKNSEIYNLVITLYFFIALFLGGGISFTSEPSPEWMTWIGRCTPVGWNISFVSDAMLGNNVWDFANGYSYVTGVTPLGEPIKTEVESWKAILNAFLPLVFAGVMLGITTKTFKWDN